jgi:GNAT superfamily N-acetyltransferase
MAPVTVERRAAADDEELFRLYREVFGEDLTESSRRRWRWQYLDNPHTGPGGPQIWVAKEDGRPLGQYASMPVVLWWGGREVRASWGMDVFLRPEARGKGLGALLFTTWSDHVEVALGLGLTPSSYGLFKKLRYDDVGPVPFLQKVLDARAVARRRLRARLPAALAAAGAALAAPALAAWLARRHRERSSPAGADLVVRPVERFGAEFDRLWETARGSYAMCVRRDAAYLNWKYVDCPQRDYARRAAWRGEDLVGYAVSRCALHDGLRLGWLLDVFAHADDHAAKDALIGAVLDDFRGQGVARAQAFSLNACLRADLERRGFFAGLSPMQFCVRSRVALDPLRDPGRWHVVFGDSDMDR